MSESLRRSALKAVDQRLSEVLSSITVARHAVTQFDLTVPQPGLPFGAPEKRFGSFDLIRPLELKRMISVPIVNPGNPSHVRMIVNLFPIAEDQSIAEDELARLGTYVTTATDTVLDRICAMASAGTNSLAGRGNRMEDLLTGLRELIREFLRCEGISIFLVSDTGDRLELAVTTGIEWNVPPTHQFYARGQGLTGRVWERKEPLLLLSARADRSRRYRSCERVSGPRDSCLMAPLLDVTGRVAGVVRCRNKRVDPEGYINKFTNDDITVLDAIGQAALPHLQVLQAERRRAKAIGRVTHELQTPLVAMRGAIQDIRAEFQRRRIDISAFFPYDFLGDLWSWSDLMGRLLVNADFVRTSTEAVQLQLGATLLMRDVVAPAVRQVEVYLRERGFSAEQIEYFGFEEIPRLYVDRNRMQQVVFNLLSNAIKYAFHDPGAFNVRIEGGRDGKDFRILFQDYGPGLKEGTEDLIFEEGYCGPGATGHDVAGQGIGLWVVQRIMEAHGGTVAVEQLSQPTVFALRLPGSLARNASPPRS